MLVGGFMVYGHFRAERRYTGRVVGVFQTTRQSECRDQDGDRRTCYSPIIHYVVEGREYRHVGPARLSWDLGGYHARVPLRYDLNRPESAYIEGEENSVWPGVRLLCFGLLPLMAGVAFGLILVRRAKGRSAPH